MFRKVLLRQYTTDCFVSTQGYEVASIGNINKVNTRGNISTHNGFCNFVQLHNSVRRIWLFMYFTGAEILKLHIRVIYQIDAIFVYFSSTCFGLTRPSSGATEL